MAEVIPINEVTIILPIQEAERFKKYHDMFMFLSEKGVFDQRNARIEIFIDRDGVIQTIQRHDELYRRLSTGKH